MATNYKFPVFAVQGGGLAREVSGKLIFVEDPPFGFTVGDDVPEQWDYQPANDLAKEQLFNEQFDPTYR